MLNVMDFGGHGPILLILHANGFPSLAYMPLANLLSNSLRILAIDMPGHGESSAMQEGWSEPMDMAKRIFNTISKLGLIGCYCFGHSLGGAMALLIEADVSPGTFSSIFVYEAPLSTAEDHANLIKAYESGASSPPTLDSLAKRRKKRFDSRESARDRLCLKSPFVSFDPRSFDLYLTYGLKDVQGSGQEVELACDPTVEEAIYKAMDPPPTASNLGKISCPLTIGVGDQEHGPHARLIRMNLSIYKSASRSKLVRFKGLSHFGPFERPEMVADSIKESLLNQQHQTHIISKL